MCTDLNSNYIKKCKNNEFENQLNNLKIVSSESCGAQSKKIEGKSDRLRHMCYYIRTSIQLSRLDC